MPNKEKRKITRLINLSICLIVTFWIVCSKAQIKECDLWSAAPAARCQYEIRGNLCPRSQSCVRHSTSADNSSNRAWRQIGLGFCTMGAGDRIRCVASVGQKWRNPVHTSREGGRKDKGDYEARMPSIIRRSTPLWVYTQQRRGHNGLVKGSFCSEDLQLLHKETTQLAISFWHVANQISA